MSGQANTLLPRVLGLPGAVGMGLGSILGTGIFVSVGVAAGVAGPAVFSAVALAAVVAAFSGLSSAQLAAAHPVSGGTYEYANRLLHPAAGFAAGWVFLCAKSASAATAALGFSGYFWSLTGAGGSGLLRTGLALLVVSALTALVAGGLRTSSRLNLVVVACTLTALLAFVVAGIPRIVAGEAPAWRELLPRGDGWSELLHATALMFVAYTGYGRIATLGEEVRTPERTIPRAVVLTLLASMALYLGVTLVALTALGAGGMAAAVETSAAPLVAAAARLAVPELRLLVTLGALTAMFAVLLNLLLGLSRVVLAMARRGDLPRGLAVLDAGGLSPRRAVLAVGLVVLAITAVGSIRLAWSFSAFTVLVYYALTNLAALRLPAEDRRFPRAVPAVGLISCLGLAFWIDPAIWLSALALLGLGLLGHMVARRRAQSVGGI